MTRTDRERRKHMRNFCYIAARIDFYFCYVTEDRYMNFEQFELIAHSYFDDLLDFGIGRKNDILMKIAVKYLNEFCGRDYYEMDWENTRIYCKKNPIQFYYF